MSNVLDKNGVPIKVGDLIQYSMTGWEDVRKAFGDDETEAREYWDHFYEASPNIPTSGTAIITRISQRSDMSIAARPSPHTHFIYAGLPDDAHLWPFECEVISRENPG